jgi:hypothetical protein
MKTVAFYTPHMGLRGTEVTLYTFAKYNEEILGNRSIVIYNSNNKFNHQSTIEKFSKKFGKNLIALNGPDFDYSWNSKITVPLLDSVIFEHKCNGLYIQKYGNNDGIVSKLCKTFILCAAPVCEPHGDVYSYISKWLSDAASEGEYPFVPSIVEMPDTNEDFRQQLNIPSDAVVFGRTGGLDTWSLPWVETVIKKILNENQNIYFIFQNTPKFYSHKNIKYLQSTANEEFKVRFINTCDAMIHARWDGESFGIACAEFSIKNKRVITWFGSKDRNHINILGEKGLFYNNQEDLYKILTNFKKEPEKDWNCYKDFNPHNVMKIFNDVFLSKI